MAADGSVADVVLDDRGRKVEPAAEDFGDNVLIVKDEESIAGEDLQNGTKD